MVTTSEATSGSRGKETTATTASNEGKKEKLADVRERVGEYTQETLETARRLGAKFEDVVRDRPLTSLLVAAGVSGGIGALIGYCLARD